VLEKGDSASAGHLGLIIGERVYNMPPQVMPPSYRMLHDEIRWALEDVSESFLLSAALRWWADPTGTRTSLTASLTISFSRGYGVLP